MLLLIVFSASLGFAQAQSAGTELHVAAAADLQPVLPILAGQFEAKTGIRIVPSFGSSATLTQQLENGSPADLFLSADCLHPQQLTDSKLTTGQPTLYARGVLVLWARHDSVAQPLSIDSLTSSRVRRIAVANDLHAPYGQAATAAIRSLHLQSQIASKLVIGENVMQTAQFAETGNAEAAFISLTIASSPHFVQTGTFVRVPAGYPPIRQCAVALAHGPNHAAADQFLRWIASAPIQSELPQYGLDPAR